MDRVLTVILLLVGGAIIGTIAERRAEAGRTAVINAEIEESQRANPMTCHEEGAYQICRWRREVFVDGRFRPVKDGE